MKLLHKVTCWLDHFSHIAEFDHTQFRPKFDFSKLLPGTDGIVGDARSGEAGTRLPAPQLQLVAIVDRCTRLVLFKSLHHIQLDDRGVRLFVDRCTCVLDADLL